MSKFKERSQTIEAITFDELVSHGIANGANVVNGMPWSFVYSGRAVSNENDDCYLITQHDGILRFQRGEMLVTDDRGGLCVLRGDLFDSHYEPDPSETGRKDLLADLLALERQRTAECTEQLLLLQQAIDKWLPFATDGAREIGDYVGAVQHVGVTLAEHPEWREAFPRDTSWKGEPPPERCAWFWKLNGYRCLLAAKHGGPHEIRESDFVEPAPAAPAPEQDRPTGAIRLEIVCMPGRCGGRPTLGDSRLTLAQFVSQLRAGWTETQLHKDWPHVSMETWRVVWAIAQELRIVDDETGEAAEQDSPDFQFVRDCINQAVGEVHGPDVDALIDAMIELTAIVEGLSGGRP